MIEPFDTGERILLEKETPLMIARHFSAYRFAKDYAREKIILDLGCGEGYGSYFLSGLAKSVLGIDYNRQAIEYAKNKYRRQNLQFAQVDAMNLNSIGHKFDVICSFQFIEHIREIDRLLEDIKNLSGDRGIFICSTPNRKDASPGSPVPFNKFHVTEFLLLEFKELLERHFQDIKLFGLKRGRRLNFYRKIKKWGIFNSLPRCINPVSKFYNKIDCDNFIVVKDRLDTALDFLAVCRI